MNADRLTKSEWRALEVLADWSPDDPTLGLITSLAIILRKVVLTLEMEHRTTESVMPTCFVLGGEAKKAWDEMAPEQQQEFLRG